MFRNFVIQVAFHVFGCGVVVEWIMVFHNIFFFFLD